MSAKSIVMAAAGSTVAPTYADDVFSAFLYRGNGGTLAIDNGIDLAGKGGMVWTKSRSAANNNYIYDSARSNTKWLAADSTIAEGGTSAVTFGSSGYTLPGVAFLNASGTSFASWTFRKAPKFFDVVTYTGNGASNRSLSHSLGIQPGFVLVKATSTTSDWSVWARVSNTDGRYFVGGGTGLNTNLASVGAYNGASFSDVGISATVFDPALLAGATPVNANGVSYIAYLFAHDASPTGLIQCGSFTADGSGNASVTSLGWEPQFLMVKASSTTGDWIMLDSLRGWNLTAADSLLRTNLTNAETTSTDYGNPTATGFEFKSGSASATYIYMAIRRPNKPPTTATSVFDLNAGGTTGGGAVAGFSTIPGPRNTDMVMLANRSGGAMNFSVTDRVRGFALSSTWPGTANASTTPTLITSGTAAETTSGNMVYQAPIAGYEDYVTFKTSPNIVHLGYRFKRAPGFFDVVGYTGTGATRSLNHNLGVVPELIVTRNRVVGGMNWSAHYVPGSTAGYLDRTDAFSGGSVLWNNGATATTISTTYGGSQVNASTNTYVTYLFATLAGISKVGTYTGNGSSQTINCGFTTGARFILIKRTNATGDWYVWDTARGVVAGNDPYLALNTTAAEVTTDDSVDTDTSGFIVNQVAATNINVSSATYLYLAIA